MSYKQPIQEQDDEIIVLQLLKHCLHLFLKNWYWFLLSVLVALVIGWCYQQRMPRIYQRQIVMLIEGAEGSGGRSSLGRGRGNVNSMLELNGVSVGGNLKNEIFILSSKRLMNRVVEKLNLQVDYTQTKKLHSLSLYKNERPFEILFRDSLNTEHQSFSVAKGDDGKLILNDFSKNGERSSAISVSLGQTVKTPVGVLTVVRGKSYADWDGEPITVNRTTTKASTSRFLGELSIAEYDKNSSLIVIGCNDVNTERADDILCTLYETYKEDVVENKNRVALSTAQFIDDRIALIGNELSNVESKLADFKKQNRVIDVEQTAQTAVSASADALQQSLQIETQLNIANYLNDYLLSHTNDYDLIPALSFEGGEFNGQIREYNTLMSERNRAIQNTSEQQQVVREMDRQLAQIRSALIASLRNYIKTVRLKLDDARRKEAFFNNKIIEAPGQEKRGLDIKRQQSLKEVLYTYLLNKREEVALQQAVNEANVRLVEVPYGTGGAISPRVDMILLISALVGFILPALIIWLRIKLDVTVNGRSDLETHTTIPLLGEVPRLNEKQGVKLLTELPTDNPLVEAFRVIRFNLGYMRTSTQVMMITSSTPGQGKSFISKNIACILSVADKSVLVIDVDIRKRTLSQTFRKNLGLTTYLVDEYTKIEDIMVKDGITEGVDFLPAGPMPPNPSELLMSNRLEMLMDELRHRYDYIIMDTTPMFSVADANILSRVVDVTLFIIRVGVQDRAFLPYLERMYREEKFNNLYLILNDADLKDEKYGYGYGYGYGYEKESSLKNSVASILRHLKINSRH